MPRRRNPAAEGGSLAGARAWFVVLAIGAVMLATGCGGSSSGGGSTAVGDRDWPLFGREEARTHYLPAAEGLDPPLKDRWSFSDRVLIEFPPALQDGVAYLADKYGNVRALRLEDQKVLWDLQRDKRDIGPPTDVTAPAVDGGTVYVAFTGGLVSALDAGSGRIKWKRSLRSTLESSPMVSAGKVILGTDKSVVYALDASSGKIDWKFRAAAPVKSSPSVASGNVFFGDYGGRFYSLDADTGTVNWVNDTADTGSGGGFYSSAAIGYGNAFAGRDDGTVFAFDLRTGRRVWSFRTGGAVYGSPALAKVGDLPPTIFIGSYDSKLYALNAGTGRKDWAFDVGGPVPGTATVIGHTVYTSSFKTGDSIGIDVRTRRKTFSFGSPGYTPMISDGKNLYLIGYFTLHGFTPR